MTVTWDITELDGGLRVVTTPLPTAQSVSVNVFVGAGSRGEAERSKGLAHFLEHMVFKGTPRRPTAIDVAEAIEGAGGVLNAYTSKELTCYWNHVPFDRLELALDVLGDMLRNSLLDEQEIGRERSVVQQEIRRTRDQPGAWVSEMLGSALFGDQPLGWSTAGTEETVGALARPDFVDWLDAWYGGPNVVLSVAGNTTPAEVAQLAARYFGNGSRRPAPAMPPLNGGLPARRAAADARPISQANLALGMPALSRKDPDRYALMVLNSLLGRGMSSRLFKEVRERRGLAYSVGSSVSRHSDTGMFAVSAGVSPEKLDEAVRVILAELEKLVQEPVADTEMTKARDYTVGSFRLSLETPMALAQRAGENLLTMGEIEPIESVVQKLQAVTPEDLLRVARRVFRRQQASLAVVGPDVQEESLVALLEA
ncbi:MAG TPA: pitrilysin family protein [Dehalococcoidia bacterium]|nr:pitrilysin family protein [Dehalococcoidia bacterium]